MCGIAGEIHFDTTQASPRALSAMADAMQPRGPDGSGLFLQGRVGLAHRRLKIIDLSDKAQQPMVDPELGLAIAFNGCIYNYKQLRAQLSEKGYRFFSHGDTEVILKAFHAWGPQCVEHFHGMFAFAIWERDTGRVTLARDRLGIKPLYLSEQGKRLRFASSLQAILAAGEVDTSIDPVALTYYMNFHAVVPAPHTIIQGVRKLAPATILTIEPDGTRKETRYWSLHYGPRADEESYGLSEWTDATLEALRTAVERRLVADVPVGVLLSGGVDSSLIVGLIAEAGHKDLQTFSVGFESVGGEAGDEFQYSDIIAERFGTKHNKIRVDSRTRLLPELPNCIKAMAEPMVSHDVIGFFLLSEEVSKHVKVVQSGQGADEVFGGYHWYPPMEGAKDPVAQYAEAFRDRTHAEYGTVVDPRYYGEDHALSYIQAHFDRPGAEDPVDKALRIDTEVMLVDDPVKRVDNMTMAWGLEARVPFLDHELVELAARIPAKFKVAEEGKYVLKEAARKVVPAEVIDRPKGYFPVPALKYLEGPVLEMARDAVSSRVARERGVFKREYIDMLLEAPNDHITNLRGSKLWQITLLELWMQTHGVG